MSAYRWTLKTIWPNLRWQWYTIYYGIRNLVAFRCVVWGFDTCDYTGLLELISVATGMMAELHEKHGHTVDAPRTARQLRIVQSLCRRLIADDYFENAGHQRDTWHSLPDSRRQWIAKHSLAMAKQDAEHLGRMFRFIQYWWD